MLVFPIHVIMQKMNMLVFFPGNDKGSPCSMKKELVPSDQKISTLSALEAFSKELINDSLPEFGSSSGSPNPMRAKNTSLGEKISETIIGVDSLCELKDARSIVPDSFEDDQSVCDVTTKKPLTPGSRESDAVLSGEIEHEMDTSKFLPDDTREAKESSTYLLGMEMHNRAVVTERDDALFRTPKAISSFGDPSYESFNVENIPLSPLPYGKYTAPISESILCRNHDDSNEPNVYIPPKPSAITENCQSRRTSNDVIARTPTDSKVIIDKETHSLASKVMIDKETHLMDVAENVTISENQGSFKTFTDDVKPCNFVDPSISSFRKSGFSDPNRKQVLTAFSSMDKNLATKSTTDNDSKQYSRSEIYAESPLSNSSSEVAISNNEIKGPLELVGCYLHQDPILALLIISKEDCLQICVLCGPFDGKDKTLFLYMVPIKQCSSKPSLLGYTSLSLPLLNSHSTGNVPLERSGIQFTPSGSSLVFLSSIKIPHCREQKINCLCSTCELDIGEENAVEIADVELPKSQLTPNRVQLQWPPKNGSCWFMPKHERRLEDSAVFIQHQQFSS